jgi:DNA-binding FadR family transcriptional regulator
MEALGHQSTGIAHANGHLMLLAARSSLEGAAARLAAASKETDHCPGLREAVDLDHLAQELRTLTAQFTEALALHRQHRVACHRHDST